VACVTIMIDSCYLITTINYTHTHTIIYIFACVKTWVLAVDKIRSLKK